MNYCVLNLPFSKKIIRKYSCSYYANGVLYPPIELLRVATIIKEKKSEKDKLLFIDSIAQNLSENETIKRIKDFNPAFVVFLISVDFINEELRFIEKLRCCSESKLVAIGYLPDLYRDKFPQFDAILGKDFEGAISLSMQYDSIYEKIDIFNKKNPIEFNPNIIEGCDYSLLKSNLYYEFLCRGKTAFTYFSFGCPFKCSYCIRTYNLNQVQFRDIDFILNEITYFAQNKYTDIRILDDNCTLNKSVLKSIFEHCNKNNYSFKFHGLTRIDLIDDEVIDLLKKMNFKRIFIGIESFNEQRLMDYNKGTKLNIEEVKKKIINLKKAGIEVGVFLLFNPIIEKRKDVLQSLKILYNMPLSFASISYITPYPETVFFKNNIENIEMGFEPSYFIRFKNKNTSLNQYTQYLFFLIFYLLHPIRFMNMIKYLILFPKNVVEIITNLIKYSINRSSDNREDFF